MELGLCTFADVLPDGKPGGAMNTHQRFKDLMEEIELAEQVGLDVFAVGEHHRPDYAVSSPSVVLAAAAARTKRLRLSSGVTVLSSDDPVRVFQQFATLDQLSGGRAEIMAGRGSFIESYPLFGYDLKDYDELFAEKLELLLKINENEIVTWQGKHTPSIEARGVYPRPYQQRLPVWIAVGGTPQSAIRAGKLGLPLSLAIIGGYPRQFVPFIELYKKTVADHGHVSLPLSINSHVYVAGDSRQASDEYFPTYSEMMNRIGRERGWPPMKREQFEASRSSQGALLVGSPEEVTDKILMEHELFGNTRFLAQISVGTLAHDKVMKAIELFGTRVAPAVRKAIKPVTSS